MTPVSRFALSIAAALSLAGCQQMGETYNRGYIIDEAAVASVRPGTDVQAVLKVLGTPSTVSTVGNKTFYYISQTAEQKLRFLPEKITDQHVVAVYFNKGFKVERVANYGLQDGVVFDFISRTTPTSGQEQAFVRQLFRGIGSFNPFGV